MLPVKSADFGALEHPVKEKNANPGTTTLQTKRLRRLDFMGSP
jgi:hypothetical protein